MAAAVEKEFAPLKQASCKTSISLNDFRRLIIREVDFSATPGFPLSQWGSTNKDVFRWDGIRVDEERLRMVYEAVILRLRELDSEPVSDLINLFIKDEPHKRTKVVNKAWRMIFGISLVDNLVCRILLGDLMETAVQRWAQTPSKVGWAPSGAGFTWMVRAFGGRQVLMADKSSWDNTVQPWMVKLLVTFYQRMYPDAGNSWRRLVENHILSLFGWNTRIKVGDLILQQQQEGILKSGWYLTILSNSVLQFAVHALACKRLKLDPHDGVFFAMGDDTVQDLPNCDLAAYLEQLTLTGCLVKEHKVSRSIEFAGHVMTRTASTPVYGPKHAWLLSRLNPDVADETLQSYLYLYTFHADMQELIRPCLLARDPARVPSRELLQDWYCGDL